MAGKKLPVFDFDPCISCGICVQACPVSSIELSARIKKDPNLYPAVNDSCLGCGSCQRACPMGAISMREQA